MSEQANTIQAIEPFNWDSNIHHRMMYAPQTFRPGISGLPKDLETFDLVVKALREEKEGIFDTIPDQTITVLSDRAAQEAVGTGRAICPICNGSATRSVQRLRRGRQTGIQVLWPSPCACKIYQKYFSRWANPAFVSNDHRDCTMANLLSGKLKDRFHFKQKDAYETMIAAIKAFPFYNCLIVGPAGAGKTTLMTALYDQALWKWAVQSFKQDLYDPAVWKVRALQLADEQHAWAMRGSRDEGAPPVPLPTVTEKAIETALKAPNHFTPHVSLDEFDKYKMLSEFQNSRFHAIIDTCQANGGQVVCNSNIDLEYLRERLGTQYGDPMIRRLIGPTRGMYLNFWYGKVYVNNVRHVLDKGELVPVESDRMESVFMEAPAVRASSRAKGASATPQVAKARPNTAAAARTSGVGPSQWFGRGAPNPAPAPTE